MTASYCNSLQHALQRTATHCNILPCTMWIGPAPSNGLIHEILLPHTATSCNTHCNTLLHTVGGWGARAGEGCGRVASSGDCNTLQHTARYYITLQHTTAHCNTLRHIATRCKTMGQHHTATHCSTLRHTATHRNTLQHTATHCNTMTPPSVQAV